MRSLSLSLDVNKELHKFTITGFLESQKKLHENVRDGRGSYFFHGAGRGKAKNQWDAIIISSVSIKIIISIITSINAIIINATRDDILDMEELFHMLTNLREQSLMPC